MIDRRPSESSTRARVAQLDMRLALEGSQLVHGDCLEVMQRLPDACLDLIYIDPPFFTGSKKLGPRDLDGETHAAQFDDHWPGGLTAYLSWLMPRIADMHRLLKDTGSMYIHLDWHAVHYVKVEADRIFGYDNFLNEIVWLYGLGGSSPRYWPRKHDTILWYAKNAKQHYFVADRIPATSQRLKGQTKKAPDTWDIPALNNMSRERSGYPTQKPEALLERIVRSSCPEDGLFADFFCGSGTSCVAAERLGRKWIASDTSSDAIQTTESRLHAYLAEQIAKRHPGHLTRAKGATSSRRKRRVPLPSFVVLRA